MQVRTGCWIQNWLAEGREVALQVGLAAVVVDVPKLPQRPAVVVAGAVVVAIAAAATSPAVGVHIPPATLLVVPAVDMG